MASYRFEVHRHSDPTGLSGTGVIAEGVTFDDGRALTRWNGYTTGVRQIDLWDHLDDILLVHGHGGATEIHWVDDPPDWWRAPLAPVRAAAAAVQPRPRT